MARTITVNRTYSTRTLTLGSSTDDTTLVWEHTTLLGYVERRTKPGTKATTQHRAVVAHAWPDKAVAGHVDQWRPSLAAAAEDLADLTGLECRCAAAALDQSFHTAGCPLAPDEETPEIDLATEEGMEAYRQLVADDNARTLSYLADRVAQEASAAEDEIVDAEIVSAEEDEATTEARRAVGAAYNSLERLLKVTESAEARDRILRMMTEAAMISTGLETGEYGD